MTSENHCSGWKKSLPAVREPLYKPAFSDKSHSNAYTTFNKTKDGFYLYEFPPSSRLLAAAFLFLRQSLITDVAPARDANFSRFL